MHQQRSSSESRNAPEAPKNAPAAESSLFDEPNTRVPARALRENRYRGPKPDSVAASQCHEGIRRRHVESILHPKNASLGGPNRV